MSTITISDLKFLPPQDLATLLSSPETASKISVIDVRDDDHIGGHIKNSNWVPVQQLEVRIPELIRVNKDKDKIVFHCMLSQQRGPSAALKFLRALASWEKKENRKGPEVCVLQGGFGVWQARYGENENLTEGYVKDLFE